MVRPEGASGQGTRQATAADFGSERPPQDQPKGKCLHNSYPLLVCKPQPAQAEKKLPVSTEEKIPKFREMSGTGPIALNTFYLAQKWSCSRLSHQVPVHCRMRGSGACSCNQAAAENAGDHLFTLWSAPSWRLCMSLTSAEKYNYHKLD